MSRRLAQGPRAQVAPVEHPAVDAVIALGSNLGDRRATLEEALKAIELLPLVDGVRSSPALESVAVTLAGPDEAAPAYLNAIVIARTRLAPSVLLSLLHRIEAEHGRERRVRWGDRTLDLDLVAYGEVISDDPALRLPHPRAAERDFVLAPWLHVDPDAVLPGLGRVEDLLADLRRRTSPPTGAA